MFAAASRIPARSVFRPRERAGNRFPAACAMLARRGGPGSWNGPEVPVLEREHPCVLISFQALAARPETQIPYPHRVVKAKMSHLSKEKLDLLTRTKKIVGQLEAVGRALDQDEPCAEVLQRLSAARGAINSLMGELMEDHIRNHMPRKTKSAEEAADDLIEIVRTYLK
jgi:FrmR/RcnR family transcriptional regulator, repressor of frmRAB operon